MKELEERLLEQIAAECNSTIEEAEENLAGSIKYLQELKLEGDLTLIDIYQECEGLLGIRLNHDFMTYVSEQTEMCNIPHELKDLHNHEDDEDFEDYSEFNPYDWRGEIGEELVQELMESIF